MKVSMIVPVYNAEHVLFDTLGNLDQVEQEMSELKIQPVKFICLWIVIT